MLPQITLGSLQIPTYFLIISLTCCACMLWFWRRAIARELRPSFALDLSLVIFISGFLGARFLHVVWEQPRFYLSSPWQVLNVFSGGYVFLGGALAATVSAFFYCRRHKEIFWAWADLVAPVAALGYALGRISCFLQGCCYGKACELPWAVTFPSHSQWGLELVARHPTQVYATILEFGILVALLWLERRPHKTGEIFLSWVIMHSTSRVFLEIFRDDPRGFAPLGISLATWISLVFVSAAVRFQKSLETRR